MRKFEFVFIFPLIYLFILLFQVDLALRNDLGTHLKVGELIFKTMSVPNTNVFSYVAAGYPTIEHSWLSEVVFYIFAHSFGLISLLYLKIVLALLTCGIMYYLVRKQSSLFWTIAISIPSVAYLSTRFSQTRPELFTYLFISLFLLAIYKYKTTKKLLFLWLLPFVELFWVNMHIYFFIGIALYAFFLLDELIFRKNYDRRLFIVGIVVLCSTLLNPAFIKGALYPLFIMNNYGTVIEENNSILSAISSVDNLSISLSIIFVSFEILLLLFVIIAIIRVKRRELFYTLTGLLGTYLAFSMVRNLGLFSLLTCIPLTSSLTTFSKNISDVALKNISKVVLLCFLIGFSYFHIAELVKYDALGLHFQPYAENATNFIIQNKIKGPIFNNDNIGEYLTYRLYPQERIFIDDRPENYPPGFWALYGSMLADDNIFQQQDTKYHFNAIVFGVSDPTANSRGFLIRMIYSNDWAPVYADGNVTILLRRNSENAKTINRYKLL